MGDRDRPVGFCLPWAHLAETCSIFANGFGGEAVKLQPVLFPGRVQEEIREGGVEQGGR